MGNNLKGLIWAEVWGISGVFLGFLNNPYFPYGLLVTVVGATIGLSGQYLIGRKRQKDREGTQK